MNHGGCSKPDWDQTIPSSGCSNPSPGYTVPSSGCSNPSPDYTVPSSGCSNPSPGYAVPSPGCSNPSPDHAVPSRGCGVPLSDSIVFRSNTPFPPRGTAKNGSTRENFAWIFTIDSEFFAALPRDKCLPSPYGCWHEVGYTYLHSPCVVPRRTCVPVGKRRESFRLFDSRNNNKPVVQAIPASV